MHQEAILVHFLYQPEKYASQNNTKYTKITQSKKKATKKTLTMKVK